MSRRQFVQRAALAGAALAFPWTPPSEPDMQMVETTPVALPDRDLYDSPGRFVEWWYESNSPEVTTVKLQRHGVPLETRFVPPRSAVYVQYPLGRAPEIPDSVVARSGADSSFEVTTGGLPRVEIDAVTVMTHGAVGNGTFGMMWAE